MTPLINQAVQRILPVIKEYEGFVGHAYRCPANKLTIGWGRTMGVKEGDVTTPHEEEPWLIQYLEDLAVQLLALHPFLTYNQLAALLSFTYNIGIGAYSKSTLRKLMNDYKVVDASNEFAKWNKGGRKVLAGLTKRRAKEREVFLNA